MSKTIVTLFFIMFFFVGEAGATTKIKIVKTENLSRTNETRIQKIVLNLEAVINSQDLKGLIIGYSQGGKKQFVDNRNKSNEEIYNDFINGEEGNSPGKDKEWDLYINSKWLFSSSVNAYTSSDTHFMTFNSRYLNRSTTTDSEIANTICHEYLHKLGYQHSKKWTKERDYTVPYAVGDICEVVYINLFPNKIVETHEDLLKEKGKGLTDEGEEEVCNILCLISKVLWPFSKT